MKSILARELCRNWTQVLKEHAGTEVRILDQGYVVAYLRVPARRRRHKVKMPDFQKRLKAIYGDRMLTKEDVEWLDEAMRGRY